MTQAQQTTITPQRQMAASQVGAVFNSLHEYLRTLEPHSPEGRPELTKQLEFAHQRIDEAAMWAIKSVLTYGLPPAPPSGAAPVPGNTDAAAVEPVAEPETLPEVPPVVVPLEDNAVIPDAPAAE